jgi:predicted PurR-regulated permease PerM
LLEYRFFSEKIKLIFLDSDKRDETILTIGKIKKDIKSYFWLKAIVSFSTGVLSYFVMRIF